MGIYQQLGLRTVINANATRTDLGGSLMPESVLEAMREAAGSFVDMYELQEAVSSRIAELTHNEAALVCTGCAAALFLSAIACMTGPDIGALHRLIEDGPGAMQRNEVVVHTSQRNPYDPAIRLAGARIIQVGDVWQTFEWELESVLGERTAAVFYFYGNPQRSHGALPLETVIEISHKAGIPVVVDAAAQLPPAENLWRFTEMGADLAVFSGGKGLRGPQASGLMVGRRDLIEVCRMHAAPLQRLARPMKVGKEEMVGLLAAIERYVDLDQDQVRAQAEITTAMWIEALSGLPGVEAQRSFPSEAGQPLPRAVVTFNHELGLTGKAAADALMAGDPPISVAVAEDRNDDRSIYVNPETLQPGEEIVVRDRLVDLAQSATGIKGLEAKHRRGK